MWSERMGSIIVGGCDNAAYDGDLDLTPTQQRTLDLLRRAPEPVLFDRDEIRELIEAATLAARDLDERAGEARLVVTKTDVSGMLGCEAQHLARDPFEWSVAMASGTVTHRAIQLAIHWTGDPVAAALVDEAIVRIGDEDKSLSSWLNACSGADLADLRGACQQQVVRYLESFPPIPASAAPVVEARNTWRLNAAIQFKGRVDLMLGRPRGTESTRLLIDFKSGKAALSHGQDLRHYALLETLIRAVPPRAVASYYLSAGEAVVEPVTIDMLHSALERALAAADALVATKVEGRPAVRRPGFSCRWCSISEDCPVGQAWLRDDDIN